MLTATRAVRIAVVIVASAVTGVPVAEVETAADSTAKFVTWYEE